MKTDAPKTIYLKDYKPFPYTVESVDLNFDIHQGYTTVTATTQYKKKSDTPLVLNGENLELVSIERDGKTPDYTHENDELVIQDCPDIFSLKITTKIKPEQNTRLEGLYKSGNTYCTQCESQGFRHITFYPDRPDVLTIFTTRVEADKSAYPILLSNGNLQNKGEAENGRHFTTWHDPFPKPCYLFALVAGDLQKIHDTFKTKSGREVDLYIYVRKGDENQCDHAMQSLKHSMKWDEDVYGLEYELDLFNIVAVSDFNMGAMENTSLNIFNTALVLAHQDTATDHDFIRVESVIAHEYFHNWSGNRVTCRDWFQLSLKEGLTVFRDQEFSSDLNSATVQRIDDINHLRKLQFAEDASPLAHPIRPESYIEINNFYTMTVYEKGAEVIRMIRTILGHENYRKGTDLYFSRHDGDAATCDDFVQCMSEASGIDLSHFKLWYSQAGTPQVGAQTRYNKNEKTFTITLTQTIPDTPKQTDKKPMVIPVALGLLDKQGNDLIGTNVLMLTEKEQSFTFENITKKPVPSILRGFSSPIKLTTNLTNDDYIFLAQNDTDGFNRWESWHILTLRMLAEMIDTIEAGDKATTPETYVNAYGALVEEAVKPDTDKALIARMLSLPDVTTIMQTRNTIAPDAIDKAIQTTLATIKRTYKSRLEKIYKANQDNGEFAVDAPAMARRALQNVTLSLLTTTNGTGCAKKGKQHYDDATTMTNRMAALNALKDNKNEQRDEVFDDFYNRFKNYPLVIDKWFAVQAASTRKDIIAHLKSLKMHPDFNIKNPNRGRSLYAAFAMNNPVAFHNIDGSGYDFLCDAIIELNTINPQIAARLITPMRGWRQFTQDRQMKMKAGLQRILKTPNLAPDIFEIASKSLKG